MIGKWRWHTAAVGDALRASRLRATMFNQGDIAHRAPTLFRPP
jgi:hypothetical protein